MEIGLVSGHMFYSGLSFDLHMGVAKAPVCNLPLLYTPCP